MAVPRLAGPTRPDRKEATNGSPVRNLSLLVSVLQALHVPPALTVLAALIECFGGLAVLVGFLSRPAALGLIVVMLVAISKVHWPNGFFINWALEPGKGHGIEMNLARAFPGSPREHPRRARHRHRVGRKGRRGIEWQTESRERALDSPKMSAGAGRWAECRNAASRQIRLALHLQEPKDQAPVAGVDAWLVALLQILKAKAVPAALIGPPEAGPA